MTEEENVKQKHWAAERAFSILREHFENTVVIAAAPIPGYRTLKLANHSGDIYACIGMAEVFKKKWIDDLASDAEGCGD